MNKTTKRIKLACDTSINISSNIIFICFNRTKQRLPPILYSDGFRFSNDLPCKPVQMNKKVIWYRMLLSPISTILLEPIGLR